MRRWYEFPFRIRWDQAQSKPPETWVDLFLLDQVVPSLVALLETKEDRWCIHRRWMNDKDGHTFRLDCYTDKATADRVWARLKNHTAAEAVRSLLLEWPIERQEGGTDLATGNPHWMPRTKSVYPAFIQRVCQTFREVLDALKAELPSALPDCTSQSAQAASLQSVKDYYSALETKVRELWYNDGADSFMHMTHALFGSSPFRARLTVPGWEYVWNTLYPLGFPIYPDHVVLTDIRTLGVPPLVTPPARAWSSDGRSGGIP